MSNPRLTDNQMKVANDLLKCIRDKLDALSAGDRELRFALNRKVAKELIYDERSKPAQRKALKLRKMQMQHGKCAACPADLPPTGAVLDRFRAIDGYTVENTQLICARCDTTIQTKRRYT